MGKKTVNIIGMGASGKTAPHTDGERWGISHAYKWGELQKLFVTHNFNDVLVSARVNRADWYRGFMACKSLVSKFYLEIGENEKGQKAGSNIPNDLVRIGARTTKVAEIFDIEKSAEIMGIVDLGCSLSYAISQAISEQFTRIVLYGIEIWEYGGKGLYGYQVQNVNDWLRVAEQRGIEVLIPWRLAPKIMRER